MLVLSRKRGEGVVIGKDVEVIVLEVHGDRVKLGFRTTSDVSIHREEVYQRIQQSGAAGRLRVSQETNRDVLTSHALRRTIRFAAAGRNGSRARRSTAPATPLSRPRFRRRRLRA